MTEGTPREPSPDDILVERKGLKQPLEAKPEYGFHGFSAPQLLAYDFGLRNKKFILSLDKGMGKTLVYIARALHGEPEHVIITCPTNAFGAQRREIVRHFPFYADKYVFVRGQAAQRHKQWRTPGARVFITTAATFQADCGGRSLERGSTRVSEVIAPAWALSAQHFDAHIDDEFHKTLRNRKSKRLAQLKALKPQVQILSSGSAAGKGPQDLFAALHLIDPKFWSSYWRYVETFCIMGEGFGGARIPLAAKNIDNWRRAVYGEYIFHRKKDPRDYPKKTRTLLDLELPSWQRQLHDSLREDLWAWVGDTVITAQNSLDALYRARLALICPKALDPSLDVGAGLEGIIADAQDAELTHFAISTPFRAPIPHLKAHLEAEGYKVWVLAGGYDLGPDDIDRIILEHQQQGGVIIQTIKFATSYEFLGFEHNYFLGYEYDPEDNKQAEDRWSRQSSVLPCFHWYVRFLDTYDEIMVENLVLKGRNVHMLMNDRTYWAEAGFK